MSIWMMITRLMPPLAPLLLAPQSRHAAPRTPAHRRPPSPRTWPRRQAVDDGLGRRGTSGQRPPHLPTVRQLGPAGARPLVLVDLAARPTPAGQPRNAARCAFVLRAALLCVAVVGRVGTGPAQPSEPKTNARTTEPHTCLAHPPPALAGAQRLGPARGARAVAAPRGNASLPGAPGRTAALCDLPGHNDCGSTQSTTLLATLPAHATSSPPPTQTRAKA